MACESQGSLPSAESLEARLAVAQTESIALNFARWAHFVAAAEDGWFELQALDWPDRRGNRRAMVAHARGIAGAIPLLAQADHAGPVGIYVIANEIRESVTARGAPGEWRPARKGESTSDRDVVHRRVLFVDVDAERSSGTSATDAEMAESVAVAGRVYEHLTSVVSAEPVAYAHSGNGRQLFVALEPVPESREVGALLREILRGFDRRFSTAEAKIDITVCDAKRLVPAFGTTKRKGDPCLADRPHRRTAIITPADVVRVGLDALERLRGSLEESPEKRGGRRAAAPTRSMRMRDTTFERANAVPIEEVATELGLLGGDDVRCPGCGNTNGVALVANGLKCHHKTCADKGRNGFPGFRTPVDLVMETRGVSARAAARALLGEGRPPSQEGETGDTQVGETGRTRVDVGPHEDEVVEHALRAFARVPGVYQRCGTLVEVLRDTSVLQGAPRIRAVPEAQTRALLTRTIEWVKWKRVKDGEREPVVDHPPDWAVRAVHTRGVWPGMPTLLGITEAPILHEDGSVFDEPGYDPFTQMVYAPSAPFARLPDTIDQVAACKAARLLCEPLCDFPFAGEAHRAAAVAAMLTPLARPLFHGCVPLFAIDATTRGTGKGLLADVIAMVIAGRVPAKRALSGQDEEVRKSITTLLMEATPIVIFDNLEQSLGSPALDNLLTSPLWEDRLLGVNENIVVPNRMMCMATGNNITYRNDTFRRVVPIRLQSPLENPEERDGFAHKYLRRWVHEHRPELTVAALTILRGYVLARMPDMGVRPLGSFEEWARVVPHAVVWAGLADPLETRHELEDTADTSKQGIQVLHDAWLRLGRGNPMTVAEMLQRLQNPPPELSREERAAYVAAKTALEEHVALPLNPKKVGRFLGKHRGRVVAGRSFVCHVSHGNTIWSVKATTPNLTLLQGG